MRVGVIVAARAPVPYLAEALGSVLAQEPAPDDVVVVDHGSEPPLADPGGVRMIRVEAGGGPAAARQGGLEALDTELVALADADDVWEPGKLAAQLAALAANPEAAVCFGRATVIDADGRPTGERLPELDAGVHEAAELGPALYERNAIPASSVVIRRSALDAVGGFLPQRPLPAATDWDLWLRLVESGHAFVCEPGARIRYRRHPGGLTSSVTRLAMAGLAIHARYEAMVDKATSKDAQVHDLETLAKGRIRERRYREAADALNQAAGLRKPAIRERMLKAALAIPGLRGLLGRRNPFR